MRTSFRAAVLATAVTSALLLAGCSSSDSPSSSESGPVALTYWGWAPNMDKVVAIWNASHKNIQVNYVKVDSGDPAVTKLLTAIKAGSGAPDLMQTEYQAIPTMVSANALLDISKDVAPSLSKKFSPGVWSSVTLGGSSVYAIPQDSGPMMFFYRKDIFDSLGLSAPTTWDEYAADAKTIHAANPAQYLGTFSSGDAGQFAGLTQQAGASWWSANKTAWSVKIDSAAVKKVAGFWGGLVQSGDIANEKQFTPAWNADLASGNQVGWVSAVWAPGVLSGNAAATAGKWQMSALPQWDPAAPANGNWGGSAVAVTTQSKHVAAAVTFNTWLETDKTAVEALVKVSALYPADTADSAAVLAEPNAFFSNEPDFYATAAKLAATVKPFTYGPNVNVAYSSFNDEFGKAAQAKSQAGFLAAVDTMQATTVTDLKKNGFSVK